MDFNSSSNTNKMVLATYEDEQDNLDNEIHDVYGQAIKDNKVLHSSNFGGF